MSNEVYIPQMGKRYPANDHQHMFVLKEVYNIKVDEDFPYIDKSFAFRFKQFFFHIAEVLVGYPVSWFRYQTKVVGRKEWNKNKKLLRDTGIITTCNHVLDWDMLLILNSLRRGFTNAPMWLDGMKDNKMPLYRLNGGIPVPKGIRPLYKFNEAIKSVLDNNGWVQIYPEAACWHYYPYLREFFNGACTISYRNNVPIIPLAITFRERKGLTKLFFGKEPLATLNIGKPIYPNVNAQRDEEIKRIFSEVRRQTLSMMNIDTEENNTKFIAQQILEGIRETEKAE
ncbi:MAG: lysophospholipid acyltransferase family protein [Clostridia bacterium]